MTKQQKSSLNLRCQDCEEKEQRFYPCVNPHFFSHFILFDLLEQVEFLLSKTVTPDSLKTLSIKTLVASAELLEFFYVQRNFVPFRTFHKLHSALKLLSLVMKVLHRESPERIMLQLDVQFPMYSESRMQENAARYNLNEQLSQAHQVKERQARTFVLQLLIEKKWENYLKTTMVEEVTAFLTCLKTMLPEVIDLAVVPVMPNTYIEQIVLGEADQVCKNPDPAVQILLQFLQPKVKEEDLIYVLDVLDPNTPVRTSFSDKDKATTLSLLSVAEIMEPSLPELDLDSGVDDTVPSDSSEEKRLGQIPSTDSVVSSESELKESGADTSKDQVLQQRTRSIGNVKQIVKDLKSLFCSKSANVNAPLVHKQMRRRIPHLVEAKNLPVSDTGSSNILVGSNPSITRTPQKTSHQSSASGSRTAATKCKVAEGNLETSCSKTPILNKPVRMRTSAMMKVKRPHPMTKKSPRPSQISKPCSVNLYFRNDYGTKDGEFAIFA